MLSEKTFNILEKLEQSNKETLSKTLSVSSDKQKIILGLSGGPDSILLFHFLNKLHKENKIELICAHLDHEWRKESKKDVEFCKQLCKKNNIKFIPGKASDINLNIKFNGSQEEVGRILRHTFLKKVLKEETADHIALGHHLQDQQETFLWRIIRGSSLSGLTCMKKNEYPYIRPLLNIEKKEILDYLEKNKIEYLIDKTNESDKYLRNKIRKYVIPQMEKCDPRFSKKFASTLGFLQEENEFLQKLSQTIFNKIFHVSSEKMKFIGNLKEFRNLDKVLQKRVIILWFCKEELKFNLSNNYLHEILRFLENKNGGSHQISTTFKITKKTNHFFILVK